MQIAPVGAPLKRVGAHPEDDGYLRRPDLHALDQQANQVAPREPVCSCQPHLHLLGKPCKPFHGNWFMVLTIQGRGKSFALIHTLPKVRSLRV